MKHIRKLLALVLATALVASCGQSNHSQVTGAGSSFIYPVLSIWARDFAQKGVEVNYQAIGSGGGLQQIFQGTINFAASDEPLKLDQLQKHKLRQFPMIIGGIVLAVNIPGVKNNQLVLNGPVLADIYSGKIQYWDNAHIKQMNYGLALPHKKILSIHRADGSGTTFNFTNYLSKVSRSWQQAYGSSTMISWPNGIGAKGNAGVAAQVAQTPYSIGYVEYAYAKENNMTITKMENRMNQVVEATSDSFAAAAKNADWSAKNGFYQILTNQSGKNSWPIVATTFILMPQQPKSVAVQEKSERFFSWCFEHGQASAKQLNYVAIPQQVYQQIIQTFSTQGDK